MSFFEINFKKKEQTQLNLLFFSDHDGINFAVPTKLRFENLLNKKKHSSKLGVF